MSLKAKSIRTFEDLLSGDRKFLIWANSYDHAYLQSSPPGSWPRRAYEELIAGRDDVYFDGTEDMRERLLADPEVVTFSNNLPFVAEERILSIEDSLDR